MKTKSIITVLAAALLLSTAGCDAKQTGDVQTQNTVSKESTAADALFNGWIPDSISCENAETEPYLLLQKTIIDYYEIPEEYFGETKYYYNYVDLDGDGTDEVFAVVIGSYVSGSGGNSALWCQEHDGSMEIRQAFTLVNTPIVVADGGKGKASDLYVQRSGGGAQAEIVRLTYRDGIFTNIADAQAVESIKDVAGTAIISNDMMKDMENKHFLTLADQ